MSAGGDDYFSYQAKKFKPKTAYPDSKMKVWTKPERKSRKSMLRKQTLQPA